MAKSLNITDAVNENLKLVRDEDGTDTSLSLASENNGAKVTGDLDVTGGLIAHEDSKVSNGDLTLFNGDINLSAGRALYFDGGTETFINEHTTDELRFMVGGVLMLKLDETNGLAEFLGDVRLANLNGSTYSATNSASVQTKAQIDTAIAAGGGGAVSVSVTEISEAEMNALHTSGKELVAAQGGSNVVIPISISCFVQRDASTANSASANLCFGPNDATTLGAGVWSFIKRFMYNESDDRLLVPQPIISEVAQAIDEANNRPLTAKLDNPITTGSIDAMRVVTTYYVYDNS